MMMRRRSHSDLKHTVFLGLLGLLWATVEIFPTSRDGSLQTETNQPSYGVQGISAAGDNPIDLALRSTPKLSQQKPDVYKVANNSTIG